MLKAGEGTQFAEGAWMDRAGKPKPVEYVLDADPLIMMKKTENGEWRKWDGKVKRSKGDTIYIGPQSQFDREARE